MKNKLNKVAVIGAGTMGSSIAALLAAVNLDVWLLDILPNNLTSETEHDKSARNQLALSGIKQMKNPKSHMLFDSSNLNRVHPGNMVDDLDVLSECDWIIEVVLEKLSIKQQVMKQIASVRKKGSIVSSNTSGVSITSIIEQEDDEFKAHFLGTHFFNPPRYMKLLEIIPTKETSSEVVETMTTFFEQELGKEVVIANDTPNFIGNRIGTFAYIDVMKQMEKYELSIPLADALSGPVIGRPSSATFRTADMVGIDILKNVAHNVVSQSNDAVEKENYTPPLFVDTMIEAGTLGNKTSGGFYKKTVVDGKRTFLVKDLKANEYVPFDKVKNEKVMSALKSDNKYKTIAYGSDIENRFVWETLKHTLLYSASLVPEITDDFKMIDKAMRAGFNWELGPFEIWDKLGLKESIERMLEEGDTVPNGILAMIEDGKSSFYSEEKSTNEMKQTLIVENSGAKIWHIGDDILFLEIISKGHVINSDVIEMMEKATSLLETYEGLVISSYGKNFSVGADLGTIAHLVENDNWEELEQLIERLQYANLNLKYAKKPVVTANFGMTLGGGAEVSMHSDHIVSYPETYLGLVEVGVGLVPAGGGCKEMVRRSSQKISKRTKQDWLVEVKEIWRTIAMGQVSSSSFDAINKGYFLENEITHQFRQEKLVETAKQVIQDLNNNHYRAPLKKEIPVLGSTGMGAIEMEINGMKEGQFISEYDGKLAKSVATVLCGGDLPIGTMVTEEYLLSLEKDMFLELCHKEQTQNRIKHMLTTGKPLRN
ncbi:3-hydroxyacyl-CoA dehydrogenase/enoyl-CoA hydratase family protein [Vagococcus carniphilus]|uniref:3-hydroxyacyl-CoA dehydrogenase/enoyl-CoA hydratase family protein n=1 Tax=Vagococcus carniphilus TaxID=218144 RepID=UPI002890DA10|nr:3-hydroxyacyl-CoA dehydrogenase/enoyl-CoA hydratase family protein [Vagococcus carniphilus]MDT2830634.1 3-hydroxyacyl-CoA dehydrogenase/enoyl-CoA hydratase family protein [Vagococcus carniphilus]MDT2839934.1 3-hydroxyacyl-CoA dehydrogenase/enoyl-CoA hydratase family protein [Vagococcus carniphilus]MDT2854620.1 3-hydroxyacyl-CoA dehydrogenase/enoyl-CoA hydratase family protein [Vagococcus carniphilus]